jgi:hypothetical protein
VATNAEWDPQRTPLAAVASIRPLSSSTAMDIDAASEDGPLALSSTMSQTRGAKVNRASISTFLTRRAALPYAAAASWVEVSAASTTMMQAATTIADTSHAWVTSISNAGTFAPARDKSGRNKT